MNNESNGNNLNIVKKDKTFDVTHSDLYQLIVMIGKSYLQIAVYNSFKENFIAFNQYCIKNSLGKQTYFEQLNNIIANEELLTLKYKHTQIILLSQSAVLVPIPFYNENEQRTYLEFSQVISADDIVMSDKLQSAGSFNIFNVQPEIMNAVTKIHGQVHHHSSVLIESLLLLNKHDLSPMQIHINVHSGFFDMVVIKDRKLIFYNSFAYSSAEDFIYFVLFVFEQLKISPDQSIVNISGEIEKNSAVYDILFKYIRNIAFAQPIPQISNSYILQDMPSYMYQYLFNAILCEL